VTINRRNVPVAHKVEDVPPSPSSAALRPMPGTRVVLIAPPAAPVVSSLAVAAAQATAVCISAGAGLEVDAEVGTDSPRGRRFGFRRGWQGTLSLLVGVALVGVALPMTLHTHWNLITHQFSQVSWKDLALLTVVWFAGLAVHTLVLTASLPGLSHRRALSLNLAGSSISNLVPLGGALGMSLNYAMVRSWRFPASSFSAFLALSNLVNLLARLLMPLAAVVVLIVVGQHSSMALISAAGVATTIFVGIVIVVGAVLARDSWAHAVGGFVQRVTDGVLRLSRRRRKVAARAAVMDLRARTAELVVNGWPRLLLGMGAYCVLQAVLLMLAISVVGIQVSWSAVFAVYAAERVLSLAVVTPGGVGFVETVTTGLLVAFTGNAAGAAAGILLYRGFSFLLEIPVGGAVALAWWYRHGGMRRFSGSAALPG
jgi:uncharacterized membrane protein YbhN (UPF0104 family)